MSVITLILAGIVAGASLYHVFGNFLRHIQTRLVVFSI